MNIIVLTLVLHVLNRPPPNPGIIVPAIFPRATSESWRARATKTCTLVALDDIGMFKMHMIQFSVSKILSRPSLPYVRTLTYEKAARNNVVVECGTEHKDNKSLFIFGLGYSGIGVANYFQNRGW